jgi:hypothetical protein
MAQADGIVSNGSGAAVRADINNQLAAVFTNHSGTTEPTTTYAYQFWADTTNNLLKIRNSTNSGWVTLRQLDGEFDTLPVENGTNSAPSIYFKDSGTDSGFYSPGTDQVAVSTAGVERVNFNAATEVVFNDTGADVDFRIEGDTEENLFVIDAGTNEVRVKNLNGGPLAGARNRIINGDMRIDQRNAGASVTVTSGGVFITDRWESTEDTDGTMTAQQSTTAPAGFTSSLLFTTGTADASLGASQYVFSQQKIEGFNVADLGWGTASAQSITLSFWVQSSLTGTFGGALRNSAANRSYPFTYTISAANTWEQKSVTIAGDTTGTWVTNNGAGIFLGFGLGVGSSLSGTAGAWNSNNNISATGAISVIGTAGATFYITGVQLETGSVATPFERRSYGQELALCQRYYEAQSEETYLGFPAPNATFAHTFALMFKAQKRIAPTIVYNLNNTFNVSSSAVVSSTTYAWSLQIIAAATTNTLASTNFRASAEL